jgi:hypothetical protein
MRTPSHKTSRVRRRPVKAVSGAGGFDLSENSQNLGKSEISPVIEEKDEQSVRNSVFRRTGTPVINGNRESLDRDSQPKFFEQKKNLRENLKIQNLNNNDDKVSEEQENGDMLDKEGLKEMNDVFSNTQNLLSQLDSSFGLPSPEKPLKSFRRPIEKVEPMVGLVRSKSQNNSKFVKNIRQKQMTPDIFTKPVKLMRRGENSRVKKVHSSKRNLNIHLQKTNQGYQGIEQIVQRSKTPYTKIQRNSKTFAIPKIRKTHSYKQSIDTNAGNDLILPSLNFKDRQYFQRKSSNNSNPKLEAWKTNKFNNIRKKKRFGYTDYIKQSKIILKK